MFATSGSPSKLNSNPLILASPRFRQFRNHSLFNPSGLTLALAFTSALGAVLASSVHFVSYWPYSQVLQRFVSTADESGLSELSKFLDNSQLPLGSGMFGVGSWYVGVSNVVYCFWLGLGTCDSKTRGLLQRDHIIANWPPIYIGKESDRHWEEGDDLSLLDFKAIQYRRKGNAVADDNQLTGIVKIPKREFMRRGVSQHTLEKICKQQPVRAAKLAKCLKVIEELRKEQFDAL